MLQNRGVTCVMFCAFWLENVLGATAACNFWTSDLQKVVRTCGVLHILTYKCASRHSAVPFLDIWPLESGPNMWCFAHFDLQMCFAPSAVPFLNIGTSRLAPNAWCFVHFDLPMCFAPQPCTIFADQNFQNCHEILVFRIRSGKIGPVMRSFA